MKISYNRKNCCTVSASPELGISTITSLDLNQIWDAMRCQNLFEWIMHSWWISTVFHRKATATAWGWQVTISIISHPSPRCAGCYQGEAWRLKNIQHLEKIPRSSKIYDITTISQEIDKNDRNVASRVVTIPPQICLLHSICLGIRYLSISTPATLFHAPDINML